MQPPVKESKSMHHFMFSQLARLLDRSVSTAVYFRLLLNFFFQDARRQQQH
jgi:hypothetical protein